MAGRTEHYSDFGSATIGKVSGRFELLRGYAIRALDQKYKARWITHANVTLPLARQVAATLGMNNIADVYPSEQIPANNNSGIFPFSGISPFGFNGRFIYLRTRWER